MKQTRSYFLEKTKKNELMSRKCKKVCTTSNYIDHFLILVPSITRCISISPFASFIELPIGITGSAIGLKIGVITAGLKSISQYLRKRKRNMIK